MNLHSIITIYSTHQIIRDEKLLDSDHQDSLGLEHELQSAVATDVTQQSYICSSEHPLKVICSKVCSYIIFKRYQDLLRG